MTTNNISGLTVQVKGWHIWPTMWAARNIYRVVDKLGSQVCDLYLDGHEYIGCESENLICLDGKTYQVA